MAIEVLKERSEDQTKKIEHSRLHRTMSMLSVGFAGALVIFCCLYLDERPSVLKYTVISSTLLALINAFVVCNVQNHVKLRRSILDLREKTTNSNHQIQKPGVFKA